MRVGERWSEEHFSEIFLDDASLNVPAALEQLHQIIQQIEKNSKNSLRDARMSI
jgi:hypothetical protein